MSEIESQPPVESEGAGERPDWLEAQFASPEEQARAYADARREMSRAQSELALERQRFNEALTSLSSERETPTWQPNADPMVIAYSRAAEEGDYATQLAIQMQLTQAAIQQGLQGFQQNLTPQMQQATSQDRELALRMAEQQVAAGFGERWTEIAPKVSERLASAGDLLERTPVSVESYAQLLTDQARIVEYDRLASIERQREEERQAKLAAQTLAGGTTRIPTDTDEKKQEWARVANAPARGDWSQIVGA